MIRAIYDRYNNDKWEPCFLLKVERGNSSSIDCIIAFEAKDGNGLELRQLKSEQVRIPRTRIPI